MYAGKCNSHEKLSDRRIRHLRQVLLAKEAMSYHQDRRCSFNYDLPCLVSPCEEKDPRPDTFAKCNRKSLTRSKLKKQYENVKKKKITFSGTSWIPALFIKIICSHRYFCETIPLGFKYLPVIFEIV